MRHALVDPARADDVDVRRREPGHVSRREAATDFDQEFALAAPSLLQGGSGGPDAVGREVVEHDDMRAGGDGLVGFRLGLAFDFDFDGEAAGRSGGRDGPRDRAGGPDVIVLEHGHGAEGMSVRVCATNEHAVLFNQTESRSSFARAGEGVGVAGGAEELEQLG